VSLQQAVLNEVDRLRREEQPPVLNEEEFTALARSDPKNDILDPEELQLGKLSRLPTSILRMKVIVLNWSIMYRLPTIVDI